MKFLKYLKYVLQVVEFNFLYNGILSTFRNCSWKEFKKDQKLEEMLQNVYEK